MLDSRDSINSTYYHQTYANHLSTVLLAEMRVTFRQEIENCETKYLPPIYFNSKSQTVVNDFNIDNSLIKKLLNQHFLSKKFFKNGLVKVVVGKLIQ